MAPDPSPKRKARAANYFDVGVQGRKTGITLDERERDEHGLETIDGLFSSPSKLSPKTQNLGATRTTIPSPKRPSNNTISKPPPHNNSIRSPPKRAPISSLSLPHSRSPIKTTLKSPARRGSVLPPISSSRQAAPPPPPEPQPTARTLDFSTKHRAQRRIRDNDDNDAVEQIDTIGLPPTQEAQASPSYKRQRLSNESAENAAKTKSSTLTASPKVARQQQQQQNQERKRVRPTEEIISPARAKKRQLVQQSSPIAAVEDVSDEDPDPPDPSLWQARSQPSKPAISNPRGVKKQLTRPIPVNSDHSPSILSSARSASKKAKQVQFSPERLFVRNSLDDNARAPTPLSEDEDAMDMVAQYNNNGDDYDDDEPPAYEAELPISKPVRQQPPPPSHTFITKRKDPITSAGDHFFDKERADETLQSQRSKRPADTQPNPSAFTSLDVNANVPRPRPKKKTLASAKTTTNGTSNFQKEDEAAAAESFKASYNENHGVTLPSFLRGQELEEYKPTLKRGRGRPKGAKNKPKAPSDVVPLEPWEMEIGRIAGGVKHWDPEAPASHDSGDNDHDDEDSVEIALASTAIEPRKVANSTFRFAKTLTTPFLGAGIVDLPPDGVKRAKNSRKMHMVFFVHAGKVLVDVNGTRFHISKGGTWHVPRGNFYSIANPHADPARLFFSQGCEVLPDGEGSGDA